MVHFGEFLKTWSLRSNRVTRQVSFNRSKIGGKCQNWNVKMRHFGDFQTMWLGLQLNKHRFFVVFGWNSFVQKLSNQKFNFTSKVALLIKYFGPSWLRQFCIWMLYQQRNRFYGRLLELQEECQNLRMTSDGVGATSFIPLPDANNRIVLHFFFTLY